MKNVTIKYGVREYRTQVTDGTTIGDLLADGTIRAALGFGDNVVARIEGCDQGNEVRVDDGDEVVLETRAGNKA